MYWSFQHRDVSTYNIPISLIKIKYQKTIAIFRCHLYPVGVVPVVPGPAGADPDDGGAVVDVGGQVGVVRPVLLRDLLTLHHNLVINRGHNIHRATLMNY